MLLSQRLRQAAEALDPKRKKVVSLDPQALSQELRLLARLANLMEQELAVHRLRETHRQTRSTMEATATEALAELVADPEGKVVRPNFRRRR